MKNRWNILIFILVIIVGFSFVKNRVKAAEPMSFNEFQQKNFTQKVKDIYCKKFELQNDKAKTFLCHCIADKIKYTPGDGSEYLIIDPENAGVTMFSLYDLTYTSYCEYLLSETIKQGKL